MNEATTIDRSSNMLRQFEYSEKAK